MKGGGPGWRNFLLDAGLERLGSRADFYPEIFYGERAGLACVLLGESHYVN